MIYLSNSLSGKKEVFTPIRPGHVGFYTCGPTVYDEPHLGHLRSAYIFHLISVYLRWRGYQVRWVRNVTDVDDKIIQKAQSLEAPDLNQATREVSAKYYQMYKEDLDRFGISAPEHEPKATESIEDMISLVESLIQKGFAYAQGSDVYFEVAKHPRYGCLSKQNTDQMISQSRPVVGENKRSPLDFALWKAAKPGEPSWPSPWGSGRPGWHIECSAMSLRFLGGEFDIHGGGRDLIFPHHENEIAQSECATGGSFARYWIHHGLITVNAQKMSKSLKNYVTLKSATEYKQAEMENIKILFLMTHYTAPLDYGSDALTQASAIRERFSRFSQDMRQIQSPGVSADKAIVEKFTQIMDDDFNTPLSLGLMHDIVHQARATENFGKKRELFAAFETIAALFGLRFELSADHNLDDAQKAWVEQLIEKRQQAKKAKDYTLADKIRADLARKGVLLEDGPKGMTTWRWQS